MAKARRLTSVALVVLAAAAVGYAHFVDRKRAPDADADRSADVFPSFRVEDVRRFEIVHGPERLVLERSAHDPGTWLMTSPRQEPAEPGAVQTLLTALETARRRRSVPKSEALGLDAPRARGSVQMGDVEYTFVLGSDALMPSGAAYLQTGQDLPVVVDRAVKVALLQGANAYREHNLVPYSESAIARLEVHGPSASYVLDRNGDSFRVGAPNGLRAARSAVQRLFEALAHLRVEGFVDEGQGARSTATPTTTVRVVPTDASSPALDLAVGAACEGQPGHVAVATMGRFTVSACIAEDSVAGLDQTPDALVDRSLFYAEPDEVEELILERPETDAARLEIVRRGPGWHERAPVDRDLDPDAVDSANVLVRAAAEGRATQVRQAQDGEPLVVAERATVVRAGSQTVETIEIGPRTGGFAVARRLDDGAVLRLPRDVERRLEPDPVALRPRRLWSTPFDAATLVGIENSCGPAFEKLVWKRDRWTLVAPAHFPLDAPTSFDLASFLSQLTVDAWVAEKDDGTFGFEHACTVGITLRNAAGGQAASATLVLGFQGEGGIYGRVADSPGVFVAPLGLLDRLRHPVIDRTDLRIDPTVVSKVVVTHAGRAVTLVVGKDGLQRSERLDTDAGPSDRLGAAVEAFYSNEALHTGPPERGEGFEAATCVLDVAGSLASRTRVAHIVVGGSGRDENRDIYFARVQGLDATFSVPAAVVEAILAAW